MALPPPEARYPLVTYLKTEKAHIDALNRALQQAANQLAQQIAALGTAGNPLTRMQLQASEAAIKAQLNQSWDKWETVIARGQKDVAAAASAVVSTYENELLQTVLNKDQMQQLAAGQALRAANGIQETMTRILSSQKPLSANVYQTQALVNDWVGDLVNAALAKGSTAAELAKEVKKFISPNVPGGASYAAKRLARTEINNAYHASSIDRYQKSKMVEGVDWHLSTSHPEGDICDSLKDDSPYAPSRVPDKPHPFCFCYTTPALPTREQFIDNLFAGKYDDEEWSDMVDPITSKTGLTPDQISKGTAAAESQRKKMERQVFNAKGNFNTAKGWNAESYRAWQSYTEMGHQDMNLWLRNPEALAAQFPNETYWIEQAEAQTNALVELIGKNALTDDIVVGRGVTVTEGFNPGSLKAGQTFADPAFLSTTTDLEEAANFAAGRGAADAGEGWTFITSAPKGTNAIHGADYQSEIVFKPGQVQRVIRVDEATHTIYTEMI